MLAAVLKISSTSMIEDILTYTQNHTHTRKKYSTARSHCNERKINSKRKIVTKVLLTWSKMYYHNGNSCFGPTIVSLFFSSLSVCISQCIFLCFSRRIQTIYQVPRFAIAYCTYGFIKCLQVSKLLLHQIHSDVIFMEENLST